MDKLTAAQRRFGMNMYVSSGKVDAVPDTEGRRMFVDQASGESWTSEFPPSDPRRYIIDDSERTPGPATPFVDFSNAEPLAIERTTRLQLEVLALQELLNEKDAEIDRLLEPTKWGRMLGWVIMTGTVLGVIAGVYEVIT